LSIALAMIALVGVLGGEFNRSGYGRRIGIAFGIALVVRLASLAMQASATEDPRLNVLQYLLPIATILICGALLGGKRGRKRRLSVGPSALAEA
jgi:lipopolysaccharide export system permease protein